VRARRVERIRLQEVDSGEPRWVVGHAAVRPDKAKRVELLVGEARPAMTLEAAAARDECGEAAHRGRVECGEVGRRWRAPRISRALQRGHEAIDRRLARDELALVGAERLQEMHCGRVERGGARSVALCGRRERVRRARRREFRGKHAEDALVARAQRRVVAHHAHERGAVGTHLVGVLDRRERLRPERVELAVPADPAAARGVDDSGRVAARGAEPLRQRAAIGEEARGLVAGCAGDALRRDARVEEEVMAEFRGGLVVGPAVGRICGHGGKRRHARDARHLLLGEVREFGWKPLGRNRLRRRERVHCNQTRRERSGECRRAHCAAEDRSVTRSLHPIGPVRGFRLPRHRPR
jgi:hypothetical protein